MCSGWSMSKGEDNTLVLEIIFLTSKEMPRIVDIMHSGKLSSQR